MEIIEHRRLAMRAAIWLGACALSFATAHAAGPPAQSAGDLLYDARPGDTIYGIAHRLLADGTRWRALQRYNAVSEPRRLAPGRVVRIPVEWLRTTETTARVVAATGDTAARRGQQDVALDAGATLAAGTRIRTGNDGSVAIRLADGTAIQVQPASEVELRRLRQILDMDAFDDRLDVAKGRVTVSAVPRSGPAARLEVATPKTVAGVRGTEFRAGTSDERSQFEVLEGRIGASDTGSSAMLAIGEGEGVLFDPAAGPPVVVKLLAGPALAGLPREHAALPVELRFPPVPGASRYRAQLARDDTFLRPIFDRILDEPVLTAPALDDGAYWLRVRAIDERGLEGRDEVARFAISARPRPPLSMAAADYGTTREREVRFAWTRSDEASVYHFQLARDRDFADVVSDVPALRDTSLGVELPLAVADYYWRVAGVAASGKQGPYGAANFLERRPKADTPGTPQVAEDALTLRWVGEPDTLYRVEIASNIEFTQDASAHETKGPQLTLPKPSPGLYYVRVRALDTQGRAGAFSDPQQIEIPRDYRPLLLLLLLAVVLAL